MKRKQTKSAKDREIAMDVLLRDRDADMFNIFGSSTDVKTTLHKLLTYRGIKRFYYTCIFLIENYEKLNDIEKRDKYKSSFEVSMNFWSRNVVTSNHLDKLATELLISEGFIE